MAMYLSIALRSRALYLSYQSLTIRPLKFNAKFSTNISTHHLLRRASKTIHYKPLYMISQYPSQIRNFSDDEEPPTWEDIEKEILKLMDAYDKVPEGKATLDAHFLNDLGLDSLDVVEIVMAFEDAFDVEITDDDAEKIFTCRQAVELIGRKLELPLRDEEHT